MYVSFHGSLKTHTAAHNKYTHTYTCYTLHRTCIYTGQAHTLLVHSLSRNTIMRVSHFSCAALVVAIASAMTVTEALLDKTSSTGISKLNLPHRSAPKYPGKLIALICFAPHSISLSTHFPKTNPPFLTYPYPSAPFPYLYTNMTETKKCDPTRCLCTPQVSKDMRGNIHLEHKFLIVADSSFFYPSSVFAPPCASLPTHPSIQAVINFFNDVPNFSANDTTNPGRTSATYPGPLCVGENIYGRVNGPGVPENGFETFARVGKSHT